MLDYLHSNTEGKALLATYNKDSVLDNSGRRKLCNLIVRRELQDDLDKSIKTQRLLLLAKEITEVFPKEHISTYFIPYMNYGKYIILSPYYIFNISMIIIQYFIRCRSIDEKKCQRETP